MIRNWILDISVTSAKGRGKGKIVGIENLVRTIHPLNTAMPRLVQIEQHPKCVAMRHGLSPRYRKSEASGLSAFILLKNYYKNISRPLICQVFLDFLLIIFWVIKGLWGR